MSTEHLDMEALEAKAGGRFRLVTLFQKRVRELQRGLPPLVKTDAASIEDIVAEEILKDKIWLVTGDEAKELRLEREVELKELERQRRAAEEAAASEGTLPAQIPAVPPAALPASPPADPSPAP